MVADRVPTLDLFTQDENFGGYRLARDLFIEDRAEAHVLETPAMDTSAAVGKTLGRIAHLAASRRNQLFDLGNRTAEPEHDRFAFASDDGIFHAVDVPRSIDEPLKSAVSTRRPSLPRMTPRKVPAWARDGRAHAGTFRGVIRGRDGRRVDTADL